MKTEVRNVPHDTSKTAEHIWNKWNIDYIQFVSTLVFYSHMNMNRQTFTDSHWRNWSHCPHLSYWQRGKRNKYI